MCIEIHPDRPEVACILGDPKDHDFHLGLVGAEQVEWANESYVRPAPTRGTSKASRRAALMDLAGQVPPEARARVSDPETSHLAASAINDLRQAQQEVLAIFHEFGEMTDETLLARAEVVGVKQSPSGLRTRRRELVDAGLVVFTGRRAQTVSGNPSRIWDLSSTT